MTQHLKLFAMSIALIAAITSVVNAAAPEKNESSLSNEFISVRINTASGRFSVSKSGVAAPFVSSATLLSLAGSVKAGKTEFVKKDRFGAGKRIVVSDGKLNSVSLTLYPGVPFLFLSMRAGNIGKEIATIQKIRAFSFPVALNVPADRIATQGTGFLSKPAAKPGSYVYMAVADKQTNRGVVAAWLTQDRGSGALFAEAAKGGALLTAQLDYGNLLVKPNTSVETETLVIGYFDDARIGLEKYADLVAKNYSIKLRPVMDGFCTWYSSYCSGACDQNNMKKLTSSSQDLLKPYGLDFIQIDDMWQAGMRRNGPAKNFFAAQKGWPYPAGMKAAADDINKKGFKPGIWWMPFAGDQRDPYFMKHTDWFVRNSKGEPYETAWGGTSLDMSNPGAREYIAKVASQMAKDWGYEYFKMDGLYTGMAIHQQYVNHEYKWDDIGDAKFFNPDKTNVEVFRDGLKLVRNAVGDKVFFLGCTTSQNNRTLGASFGLVDAMRIGEDNGPEWNKDKADLLAGPRAGSNRYFLNGRVWWNDPDPVYIRPTISVEHAQMIASWVGITGMVMTFSEWLPDMPPDRVKILQRIIPNHGILTRPADYFESVIPRVWVLTDNKHSVRRDVLGLFNWNVEKESVIKYDPVKAGLPAAKEYVGFDFWSDRFLPPFKTIDFTVAPGSARIIAVRPASDHPMLISTNRHITQGIVDVRDEKWDGKDLTGVSKIVGGERYELRIVIPADIPWILKNATCGDPGVKVSIIPQKGTEVRVSLESDKNIEVSWRLEFAKGRVLSR